jgi:hypothetical protein
VRAPQAGEVTGLKGGPALRTIHECLLLH